MKVIGTTDKGFIVRMSNDEMARLAGVGTYYGYNESKPDVNAIVPVAELYTKARETIEMHETALKAAQSLKRAASAFVGYFKEAKDGK